MISGGGKMERFIFADFKIPEVSQGGIIFTQNIGQGKIFRCKITSMAPVRGLGTTPLDLEVVF